MILSDITNRGVRMTSTYTAVILHVTLYFYFTVNSFLELIPYLFKIGVSCFLSEKLSQDPLEKFFGCQRQSGTNDNPTVAQFLKNTQNLRVINSICLKEVTGL